MISSDSSPDPRSRTRGIRTRDPSNPRLDLSWGKVAIANQTLPPLLILVIFVLLQKLL